MSFRVFILTSILAISFACFIAAFWITSLVYQKALQKHSHEISGIISSQAFGAMLQLMENGVSRKELEQYLASYQTFAAKTSVSVALYRGRAVDEQFGTIAGPPRDQVVEQVFRGSPPAETIQGTLWSWTYPFAAGEKCLSCHTNAKKGEILGVLRVTQDIGPMLSEKKHEFFFFFAMLSPLPFLVALMVTGFINRRIGRANSLLRENIVQINNIGDLRKLEGTGGHTGFTEIDGIMNEVGLLAQKIRSVSIDKEMLEFQIKLLDQFIISSETVVDWKERVSLLLLEFNKVIESYTLFCIFQIDEEIYDIEIFWKNSPHEQTKRIVEEIIVGKIRTEHTHITGLANIKITHNIADPSQVMMDLEKDDMELKTKSLILAMPQIGGVVGIGVHSVGAVEGIRALVIDSILTTLLNVIGSIKAFNKYTKDLEFYATRDPLTNLFNQRLFWEMLGYEVGRAERHSYKFALLVIDLDNFKHINDSYGHLFGDKFLTEFVNATHSILRKGDIFARYGGDEFTVVLPEADEEAAFMLSDRIKQRIENLAVTARDGSIVKATVSIGAAVYPVHARTDKDLFLFADNMNYKAKSEGKNRVILPTEDDVIEVFRKKGEIIRYVMNAIEERKIIPYFQPIINLETGAAECHEVLSRITVDSEIMAAAEFIETAERLGVLSRLDLILMKKVFGKVQEENYQGYLFINLSPKSLIVSEFIPNIIKLTRKFNIDHSRVVFELTERETVNNLALLDQFVHNLKLEGFKFAIDDFGSGFSSFQYIRRFPIDFVKIEGVFIRNMLNDYRDMAFVKTLCTLAKELKIKTIAEYVEDEDILAAVKDVGINYCQGFHTGKPSPEFMPLVEPGDQPAR